MRETVARIRRMELYFDTLLRAFAECPSLLREDPCFSSMLKALIEYYEGPLWRADLAADEAGRLPRGLKRGILSEDGIYNFLAELDAPHGEE